MTTLHLAAAALACLACPLAAHAEDPDCPTPGLRLFAPGEPQPVFGGPLVVAAKPGSPALPSAPEPASAKPVLHDFWAGDPAKFLTGAFVGFLGHESGHLIANYAQGTRPYFKRVDFGFLPFFTIEPGHLLTNRQHYLTASAGFDAQFLTSEWLLTTHPNLRDEDEPFLKGMANFNFWLGVGYAATAFAGFGPKERDTRGMADSLGWSEGVVGGLVLAPTVLDYYRYRHPECKWARTLSRIAKVLLGGLVIQAK